MSVADVLLFASRTAALPGRPPDWLERERALDVQASWIVEAPAGSGKTGLLIQRYLKLLGDAGVDEPEQVLAITFTVKATAEMRERVVEQLAAAAEGREVEKAFDRETRVLAEAVLLSDRQRGWGLLERPHRLRIATIDSVCAEVARSLPVLSGSGGKKTPVTDASRLYQQAARRTLMQLGGEDRSLDEALQTMLLHRDGSLVDCEKLIAEMLAVRDQWGRLIPLRATELTEEFLEAKVLPQLERALELAICQALTQLSRTMPEDVLRELTATAAQFAHFDGYQGGESYVAICANRHEPPANRAEHLAHWRALIHLLVTPSSGTWRKAFAVNYFKITTNKTHTARLKSMIERLQDREDVLEAMCRLEKLPPAAYPREQWVVAKAFFRVLSRALVELQIVFAVRGECDFTEMGLAARTALAGEAGVDDLSAALGVTLKHLLVDEMQDTSTSQYELIARLTQGWDGHSQTLFLVGDPKQSIYRFRQARVERFVRTMKEERLGDLPLGCLRLTANFRSQRRLVERFNEDFSRLFPPMVDLSHPEEVPYLAAVAVRETSDAAGLMWHPSVIDAAKGKEEAGRARRRQSQSDGRAIREIAMAWLGRPLPAAREEPWRIAVLLRSRSHVGQIVAELKRDEGEGAVPFFATEIDALGERQEVLDLLGLTRALLHPADRVAWLAVLHAPWCGLGLADLHMLAGADDLSLRERTVLDLMGERGHMLSEDGEQRVMRVWPVLQAAMQQRGGMPLAQAVERTWRSLGGDVYLAEDAKANALRFFHLLDDLEAEAETVEIRQLTGRIKKLYAETSPQEDAVELMTIHKAKGLEWDVVIVPALERKARTDRGRLLDWMEVDSAEEDAAQVVLAPIAGKGEGSGELHAWIRSVDQAREAAERKRLLYVACTRAREELHLFAMPERNAKGEIVPAANSLLRSAWPVAETLFAEVAGEPAATQDPGTEDAGGFIEQMAAGSEAAEVQDMAGRPPMLHRLPSGYDPLARFAEARGISATGPGYDAPGPAFDRPQGSLEARAFGNAVHAMMEMMAERLASGHSRLALAAEIPRWLPRVSALLRGDGLAPAVVERQARRVVDALQTVLDDPHGHWILKPHPGAANEVARTGWEQDSHAARTSVRLDRMFRAGATPEAQGEDFLWIIDYKTAGHGSAGLDDFIARERLKYQPQLEAYARSMTAMMASQGQILSGLRLALYYPAVGRLEWWIPDSTVLRDAIPPS